MALFRLNPITRKRLRRFRQFKRAYWSFWLLVVIYGLSLIGELLCNNTPVAMRFEGETYFPIIRFYPDDTFTGSGHDTRPDYKAINAGEAFQTGGENWMLFPPHPFGPFESARIEDLEEGNKVYMIVQPNPRIGTVNITSKYEIKKTGADADFFFDLDQKSLRNLTLTDYWVLPQSIKNGVAARFQNEEAPTIDTTLRSTQGIEATVALSQYKPRKRPPRTVRLTFREVPSGESNEHYTINRLGNIAEKPGRVWSRLSEEKRGELTAMAEKRFTTVLDPINVKINDLEYRFVFEKEDIAFPYRPATSHPMGLDSAGRDVLSRIIYGLRIAMTFGLALVLISMTVGIAAGAIQGYYGGLVDIFGQRFTEIWAALPFLYVMILMASVFGPSFLLLLFCFAIFNWIGISYYMRAEFLRLRRQPFVEAAKCMGLPSIKIIFRHILPNGLVPVITFFPFSLIGAIGVLTALDYLGYGLPPPTPSWGELLSQAQEFKWAWWLVLYPFVALFVVMLLFVFVGEGVRSAFDPKAFQKME